MNEWRIGLGVNSHIVLSQLIEWNQSSKKTKKQEEVQRGELLHFEFSGHPTFFHFEQELKMTSSEITTFSADRHQVKKFMKWHINHEAQRHCQLEQKSFQFCLTQYPVFLLFGALLVVFVRFSVNTRHNPNVLKQILSMFMRGAGMAELCPAVNWRLVHRVPCLLPKDSKIHFRIPFVSNSSLTLFLRLQRGTVSSHRLTIASFLSLIQY